MSETRAIGDRTAWLLCIALHALLLFALYGQTLGFDYVYFDDSKYVLENLYVRSGLSLEGVKWAFTSFYMSNWHPLTWLSHMVDTTLWGVEPGWAHIHNALLHGIVSLLLCYYLLLILGDRWKALLLSLVFLVHPLHVESVAWIAERKDVLCALFFMLGLLLYHRYRDRPVLPTYLAVFACYALAVMAKPMAVTFPAVLLVMDAFYYRDKFASTSEIRFALVEKLPLFLLAALISAVAIIAQREGGAMVSTEMAPVSERVLNAAYAYVTYLKQMLVPLRLAAFYPLEADKSFQGLLLPALLLVGWMAAALIYLKRLPLIAAGLCWYLGMLVPVIGLIQVGNQLHADRYMYLPSIGVLLALSYLIPARGHSRYRFGIVLGSIVVLYFSLIAHWQVSYWENRYTLFTRVLTAVGPNWHAHISLAGDAITRGDLVTAQQHGEAALALRPELAESHQTLGDIAMRRGDPATAITHYSKALEVAPANGVILNNLAMAFIDQGQWAEAREALTMAQFLAPNSVYIQENLARLQALEGAN